MNFEYLGKLFGEGAQYTMKNFCSWCNKPIKQTEERFKTSGNCCGECNAHYNRRAMEEFTERQVTQTDRIIKQTRLEMDTIALKLEQNLSEEERLKVVGELERKFIKIKMLKGE